MTSIDPYRDGALYLQPSELAHRLGLKYEQSQMREIPILFEFLDRGGYSVGVVRRFVSKDFAVDISQMEFRPGLSQKLIDLINRNPELPKLTDDQGEIIKKAEQIQVDWNSQQEVTFGTRPERSINYQYDRYIMSLSPRQREVVNSLHAEIYREGKNEYNDLIRSYIDFAHAQYARRGWSPDMLAKLEAKALQFANQSTFITVRKFNQDTNEVGEIVGNLRLIRAPYTKTLNEKQQVDFHSWGPLSRKLNHPIWAAQVAKKEDYQFPQFSKAEESGNYDWKNESPIWNSKLWSSPYSVSRSHLMMEDLLGVILPRPAIMSSSHEKKDTFQGEGEIVEPGAFAIDKKVNAAAFAEILSHLMLFVVDPNFSSTFNYRSRAFYTYNDYPQLYSGLGFKKLGEPYKVEFNEKTGKDHNWWILRAMPDDILSAIENIAGLRKNLETQKINEIRALIDAQ